MRTFEEFLEAFKDAVKWLKTDYRSKCCRGWGSCIRLKQYRDSNEWYCPITMVYKHKTGEYVTTGCAAGVARDELGMPRELVDDIIDSADDGRDCISRKRLLDVARQVPIE